MSDPNANIEAIYEVVQEFNRQLPPDARLECSPETVLIGDGGVLDSLGLINLLVLAEDSLEARVGQRVVLLDEKLMTADKGPLRTLGSLSEYVTEQIGK